MSRRGARGLVVWSLAWAFASPDARAQAPVTAERAPATETTGVLCLRKLPGQTAFVHEGKGSSTPPSPGAPPTAATPGRAKPPRLQVSVDGRASVTVDQKHGGCVDGLALGVRHVMRVSRDGRALESASFTFSDQGPNANVVELRYDPFYAHVQLESPRRLVAPGPASCAVCADPARAAAPPHLPPSPPREETRPHPSR